MKSCRADFGASGDTVATATPLTASAIARIGVGTYGDTSPDSRISLCDARRMPPSRYDPASCRSLPSRSVNPLGSGGSGYGVTRRAQPEVGKSSLSIRVKPSEIALSATRRASTSTFLWPIQEGSMPMPAGFGSVSWRTKYSLFCLIVSTIATLKNSPEGSRCLCPYRHLVPPWSAAAETS